MMGEHGSGSDPRIAALGDVVAVLRLLAEPGGLKEIADDLDARRKTILSVLDAAYAKGEAQLDEIAQARAELETRGAAVAAAEQVHAKREQEIIAAAAANDSSRGQLAAAAAQAKADQAALTAAQTDLAEQQKASQARHEQPSQTLESAHAPRMA